MTTEQQETRRPSLPGDIITSQEQLDALPENSYVQALGDTRHWRKKAHHGTVRWSNPEGGWLTPGTEWADHFSTLGHQVVVDTINRPIEETPEQFAARFRDIVLWSEESHYGGTNISLQVLNDLGEEFAFKPSVGMRLHAQHDLALLPNGTRVYTGDPADAQTFGLWVKQDAGWTRLFGGTGARRPQNSRPGIIDALAVGDTV
jgi:hypothetical protein